VRYNIKQSEIGFIDIPLFNSEKKQKEVIRLKSCVRGSSIENVEDDRVFRRVSSGIRSIRIPLSYLGVLYTDLAESLKQFS
jgi:hypothetical protein